MSDEVVGNAAASAAAPAEVPDVADGLVVIPAPGVPAIAPPPGFSGIFDGYDPNQLLDMSHFSAAYVFCNIYDLGDSDATHTLNDVTTAVGKMLMGGLFHCGIEVFGAEWSFGCTEEARSGVFQIAPRGHSQHIYRTTVPLGETKLTMEEVQVVMENLSKLWKGNNYHSIHYNCQNFSNHFCRELGVREIPGWVDRVARTASTITDPQRAVVDVVEEAADMAAEIDENLVQPTLSAVADGAEELSRKAELAAAAVLGQDFAAKAKQVGEQSLAFTSSLWRAARGLPMDLPQEESTNEQPQPSDSQDTEEANPASIGTDPRLMRGPPPANEVAVAQ